MKLGENVSLFLLKLISKGISSLVGVRFLSAVGGSYMVTFCKQPSSARIWNMQLV